MAIKFRNSFLGFNKDDVHAFVMSAKENEYKSEKTIKELNEKVNLLDKKISEITAELETAKAELTEYKAKEDSLKKLSESIGKLYLVAQSNARAIAEASKENIEKSSIAVEMNINAADEAETGFAEIEQRLNEQVAAFNNEIEQLRNCLRETKERVSVNNRIIADSEKNLDEMTAEILG